MAVVAERRRVPAATPPDGAVRAITPTVARRLAVTRQRLAGPALPADAPGILNLVRDLGCLQLDPIAVVARSHLLVLHSRLDRFDPAALDALLWEDRSLFEYWAHCASIVLTEDYPIHALKMQSYATGDGAWPARLREWVARNAALRDGILARLQDEGPTAAQKFDGEAVAGWYSTGWTSGRNVSRMLDYLWIKGEIVVAGRTRPGGQKLWDLAERCLPPWTPREALPEKEVVRRAVQRSLRALGVGRAAHINQHFLRGRYPGLQGALDELAAEGRIARVRIVPESNGAGQPWPGVWYVHADDLPLLDRLAAGDWQPRTTLLSPFDNLICDRKRTEALFDFTYRIEIYVPKEKRQYGYYVLPILHGDRPIGRIDPALDRNTGRLTINAVHAEPDAPDDPTTARAVADAVADLARFLGARDIAYAGPVPEAWRGALG